MAEELLRYRPSADAQDNWQGRLQHLIGIAAAARAAPAPSRSLANHASARAGTTAHGHHRLHLHHRLRRVPLLRGPKRHLPTRCGDPGLAVRNTLVPIHQRSHDQCVAVHNQLVSKNFHKYRMNKLT